MKFDNAFLKATAFAYFGCLIFTILGKPPMANIDEGLQFCFYIIAGTIFMLSSIDAFSQRVYAVLGVIYCFAAVGSFIGYPQVWMAYWTSDPTGGSAAGQIGMAFWDLAIAVLFFMKWGHCNEECLVIEKQIDLLEQTVKRLQNALIWGRICVVCGSKLGPSGKKLEDEIEQFNSKELFCLNCSTKYKFMDEKDWSISHITFPGTEARDLNFPGWRW